MLEGVLLGGMAAAYFAASFVFAGYVIKVYVEVRDRVLTLETRMDRFKRLEAQLDEYGDSFIDQLTYGASNADEE